MAWMLSRLVGLHVTGSPPTRTVDSYMTCKSLFLCFECRGSCTSYPTPVHYCLLNAKANQL